MRPGGAAWAKSGFRRMNSKPLASRAFLSGTLGMRGARNMLGQHKVGIVLSISFLALTGVVIHSRMRAPVGAEVEKDTGAKVAGLNSPTTAPEPINAPPIEKSSEPPLEAPAVVPTDFGPTPVRRLEPVKLNVGDDEKKVPMIGGAEPPPAP